MLQNYSTEHQENQLLAKILEKLCDIEQVLEKNNSKVIKELKDQTALLQEIADGLAPQPLTASAPIVIGASMANNAYVTTVPETTPPEGVTPSARKGVITPG